MKWIFITIAGGILIFMVYSTYSSINMQLKSSAINNAGPAVVNQPQKVSTDTVEKTLIEAKNQQAK